MPMMIDRRPGGRIAAGLAAALLLSVTAQGQGHRDVRSESSGGPSAAAAARRPCCYTNPQYSGPCAVQPLEGETCASILAYLNNPTSQGKTYCNSTNIRGGWKRVKCSGSNTTESSLKSLP
jgi:hypothetical protein